MVSAAALFAAGPLPDRTVFVSFDTETTGLNPQADRVIEIGAVKFHTDEVIASTNWLIHPQQPIPASASAINGITLETVKDSPVFSDVWPDIQAFCDDAVLLMHNARFDAGFLRAEAVRAGADLPPFPVVDTLPLFRQWFPESPGHSIETLSAYCNLSGKPFHRAKADAFYLFQLFRLGLQNRPELTLEKIIEKPDDVRQFAEEEK